MKQIDYADEHTGRSILSSTLPLLLAQIMSLLYNIVDRVYIGRIPGYGTQALGGVGIAFPVITLILAFTSLYGIGGAPLCSIERGRGNKKGAENIMNAAFFLISVTAILWTIFGILFARPLLFAFGASKENIAYGVSYLKIYLLGTFFSMTATGLNSYINAQGFPRIGMVSVVSGAVINIALDPIFMFTLGMGVRGAAIATVISQVISALIVIRFLTGKKCELKLRIFSPREMKANLKEMWRIVTLGMASFIMQATNSLVSIVCNKMLMACGGTLYVSVMTIVSSVRQVLDTPAGAITDGASPVISFNYGAKNTANIRNAMKIMSISAIGYTFVMWLLILLFPEMFIRIFSSDKTIIKDAASAFRIYFAAFIFQSFMYCGQTMYKALEKRGRAIFFSLLRKVVLVVPLTIVLPGLWGLGVNGVFVAEPVSNFVVGTLCFVTMLVSVLPELRKMDQNVL